ncbi:vacuolar ATP synthase subunit S1-domain-containing protein [Lipomyces tetrasporus]|uniref:Protein BIG1 n=1 Tax=Lipomyces tetrasporus TaxID=54092 RepID=A0AAD7QWJ7_9ASCO|nr:vacuolar ATP synthase subunit S1-domain-containing protein [Lipomyces tetrasporus]KAJ8102793.1 vacuolar ATP synthase subunit S1-domain-containing protein [Lipomyces tetrasporus]
MLFSSTVKGAVLALAASLSAVNAFEDTSPLMLLSSKKVPAVHDHLSSASITSSDHFHDLARKLISELQADTYIVVSQPGLHASDFSAVTAESMTPNLRKLYHQAETAYAVRNAHGSFDMEGLEKHIVDTWGTDTVVIDAASNAFTLPSSEKPQLVHVDFPVLPVDYTRASALADNDAFLYSVMSLLQSDNFAVIYTSTPVSRPFVAKRNPVAYAADAPSPTNSSDFYLPTGVVGFPGGVIPEGARTDGSVFTRYQFFTPGMFMAIIASVVLVLILGVGLKSISSIAISYDAFQKEMGPQTVQSMKK